MSKEYFGGTLQTFATNLMPKQSVNLAIQYASNEVFYQKYLQNMDML